MADWPDVSVPRALLAALALAMAVLVAQAATTSAASFSVSNARWDGSSRLTSLAASEGVDARPVTDTAAYGSVAPNESVAVVLSPESRYRSDAVLDAATFVRRGGTLVVAAEGPGPANALLAGVGASARVGESPVYDVRKNFRTAAMPVASNVSDRPLVADVPSLTLNHGTVVRPDGATALVNTSEYAYLDRNRNGQYDGDESLARRPVATVERIGRGRVVVVSDASVFINAMLKRPGNRKFARALVDGKSTLLLDYSHATGLAALPRAVLLVRNSELARLLVGALAVGALAAWTLRPTLPSVDAPTALQRLTRSGASSLGLLERRTEPLDREGLVASLTRRYPDRDRETVERVVSRFDRFREE